MPNYPAIAFSNDSPVKDLEVGDNRRLAQGYGAISEVEICNEVVVAVESGVELVVLRDEPEDVAN